MPRLFNKVVKFLVASDFFLNLGWGLLSPVFALFILQKITIGDPLKAAEVAGLSALFYWIPKSLFQIPIGILLDKKHGERDDLRFMIIGTLLASIVPIGYIFSYEPWHIYFWQVVHAIAMALAIPSWLAIFTRHVDKGKEAFEWSFESTSIGLGAGVAGGLGGIISGYLGFGMLFALMFGLNIISVILLLFIKKEVFVKRDGVGTILEKPVVTP
jgi:hypothetical protein